MSKNVTPLAENLYIKEVFAILEDNGKDVSGLAALISHVGEMESFVKDAENKITDMKLQLYDMKEMQNHPVKTQLQKSIGSLELKMKSLKIKLFKLIDSIVKGCKAMISAFKREGILALDKIATFFDIKNNLQNMKNDVIAGVNECDRAIQNVDIFSKEYHSAGKHLQNMARMVVGKQPVDVQKEAGKIAMVASSPYKTKKVVLIKFKNTIDNAIEKLAQLENMAAKHMQNNIVKRPSMLEVLGKNKAQIAQNKVEKPAPERNVKAKEAII